MALSPVYAAILQDLNKAVAQSQPEDVLQYCANWFNAKLEEQRIAGRLSIAQAEQHGIISSSRSKSLAPAVSPVSGMKKKVSLPSLVGQGYTFGSSANGGGSSSKGSFYDHNSNNPSPFSEAPPMPSISSPSRGVGGGSSGHHPHHLHQHQQARGTISPSAGGGHGGNAGISWNRPFPPAPGHGSGDADMQEDDEESLHMRGSDRHGAISPASRNVGNTSNNHHHHHHHLGAQQPTASGSGSGLSASSHAGPDSGIPQGYNLGRRTSVSAESIDPNSLSNASNNLPKVIIPKTPSQRARIESSTEKNLLFRNLDEEQHNDVVNAMKEVSVTKGTEVIVQGAVGDFFYVVESGDFQVWVKPQQSSGLVMSPSTPSANPRARSVSVEPEGAVKDELLSTTTLEDGSQVRSDGSKLVASITSGGSFGELALMYNAPRAATVLCSSETATLWALDRVTFRTILMEHTSKKRRMYEKFLSEVPILVSLEGHERSKIADALEERIYEEGEDVVREGELGKNFYIIESGKAEVLKRKEGGHQERVGTLTKGDYFGELALLNSAPRAATVRAVSGRLRVATLGEKAFTRLLGPVVEILTRSAVTKYGPSSVASTERERGGAGGSGAASGKDPRHERERSGTSTPTVTVNREREREREREKDNQ